MAALFFNFSGGSSQNNSGMKSDLPPAVNRKPAVAGQFYPGSREALNQELKSLFSGTTDAGIDNVLAVISPHAGYVFSGAVAAQGFRQINSEKKYDNIFIIASSHRVSFNGASIFSIGNYETPLGEVRVNRQLARKLIDENDVFSFREEAHTQEHSLEVQLPFLQYIMEEEFSIVPIVIGSQNKTACRDIALALKPYFNDNNLFIISSDFSHYPEYDDAVRVDKETAMAIASNNPATLYKVLDYNEEKNISSLATSLCGWTAVSTLLNITRDIPGIQITPLKYNNSGDAGYGDKNRVVGYYSILVAKESTQSESNFMLSEKDKNNLLNIARQTLINHVSGKDIPALSPADYSPGLQARLGTFVTLTKDNKLRGCIGSFNPSDPLFEVVQKMTVAASSNDSRFEAVSKDELPEIEIEISVLTPMKKIDNIDEIILGRHGIYIKKGGMSGTFLPQVATNTGWNLEEFLGHCSRDKAGLGWTGWKDAEIYIYEALKIKE